VGFPKQFKMIYRLTSIRTKDGYLKITASIKGTPSLNAIHLNPDVLAVASRLVGVSEQDVLDLKSGTSLGRGRSR
jgi:hypothetical protein